MFFTVNKDELKKALFDIVVIVLLVAGVFYWGNRSNTHEKTLPDVPSTIITEDTEVTTTPKTSAKDNDVELTQTYSASINGQKLSIPIVNTSPNGTKGIITQQIDLTPAIKQAAAVEREKAKEEFKKNWEIGIGLGVHQGDAYVPLQVQRNYAPDKAIEVEIHLQVPAKVTGGEVLHKWML